MFNNFGSAFKISLTIVNDCIRKDAKLNDDKTIFKAVEEEEIQIKIDQKVSANFAAVKSYTKP